MTAVRGTFADFKTVKTRGVCQLIIEVPIENADHALAVLGGVPQAKAEQWVGIAPVTAPEDVDGDDVPAETENIQAPTYPDVCIMCGLDQVNAKGICDNCGQRYVDVNSVDATPVEPAPLKGGRRAKMAGILCGDAAFQIWMQARAWRLWQMNYEASATDAAEIIRANCNVSSRAELDHNDAAGIIWDRIESDYRASQRGDTDEARLAQRADGPS